MRLRPIRSVNSMAFVIITFILISQGMNIWFSDPVSADDPSQVIFVGAYENKPKIYTDDEGELVGFFPDLVNHIGGQEGWDVRYIHGNWSQCLERLEGQEIDVMVDVGYSESRAKIYDFCNEVVLINWATIYTTSGSDITSLPDLQGKRVATMKGSIHTDGENGIINMTRNFDINCTFIEVENYTAVVEMLDRGEVDAGVVNRIFGLVAEPDYSIRQTPIVFNPRELRFAFPKNSSLSPYLIERFDHHLELLKNDPESEYYQSLETHLFATREETTVEKSPGWVFPLVAGSLGLIALFVCMSIILEWKVKLRTVELEKSKKSFSNIVGMTGEAHIVTNVNGEVKFANPAAGVLLGKSIDDIMGQKFSYQLDPTSTSEIDITTIDGEAGTGALHTQETRWEGRSAFLTTIHDVTESKKVQEEIISARKAAERSDRLKSAFLAAMSHELRTPLNSIIGFTGILLSEMSGPLNDEQKKQLGMVQTSAKHLLDLINDVLDLSKIEAGDFTINREPFDLRGSIEKVVQTVFPMAEKKGLTLDVAIDHDLGTIVNDQRRFEQVLMNLLTNAIKFTGEGKVLVVCFIINDQVNVRVVDTGIGIKEQDMDKLFKQFQQIDSGITRKHEGTGLGLSISKKLLEMMSGEIHVESEWGKGSVFSFTLPLERSDEQ
jgi:signal transduction histidine kinase/ABC-type amino acid transport substrate-binding protein